MFPKVVAVGRVIGVNKLEENLVKVPDVETGVEGRRGREVMTEGLSAKERKSVVERLSRDEEDIMMEEGRSLPSSPLLLVSTILLLFKTLLISLRRLISSAI